MPDPNDPPVVKMEDESILKNISKLLGNHYDQDTFDLDILLYINSTFARLQQLGVGGTEVFQIEGPNETWGQFTKQDNLLMMVIPYIRDSVKLLFDPPQHGPTIELMKSNIAKQEFLLNVAGERVNYE